MSRRQLSAASQCSRRRRPSGDQMSPSLRAAPPPPSTATKDFLLCTRGEAGVCACVRLIFFRLVIFRVLSLFLIGIIKALLVFLPHICTIPCALLSSLSFLVFLQLFLSLSILSLHLPFAIIFPCNFL